MTRVAPFGFTKVVFLSHVIDDNTPVFPGDPPVEIHPAATIERNGYYLQSLVAGEQAGTHWAAPAHFNFGHAAADELDPGDFFHPAVVLDVRPAAAEDADFTLGVAEIGHWEAAFGPIPKHSAVIMWTGFEDRWEDHVAYLNADSSGKPHYPGFGADATRWLIGHRFHRRSRDRHDGGRPGCRYQIPYQPTAPSGPSHPSGKPCRTQRDAAYRWLDHHRRNPDPCRLGLPSDCVRADPITAPYPSAQPSAR